MFSHRSGTGGESRDWEWWTGGRLRWLVSGSSAALYGSVEKGPSPAVSQGGSLLFRHDVTRGVCLCVKFPTGEEQVLAQERAPVVVEPVEVASPPPDAPVELPVAKTWTQRLFGR